MLTAEQLSDPMICVTHEAEVIEFLRAHRIEVTYEPVAYVPCSVEFGQPMAKEKLSLSEALDHVLSVASHAHRIEARDRSHVN